jgi:glutamate-ammonia-ligase adenylyltransferase
LVALGQLHVAGVLAAADYEYFTESYAFLRRVESRLRLLNAAARDELPEDATELATLARGLGLAGGQTLVDRCTHYREENRRRFEGFFQG